MDIRLERAIAGDADAAGRRRRDGRRRRGARRPAHAGHATRRVRRGLPGRRRAVGGNVRAHGRRGRAGPADPATYATSRDGVFAGGSMLRAPGDYSAIQTISDGKRAAISIDRYLQGVSMTAVAGRRGQHDLVPVHPDRRRAAAADRRGDPPRRFVRPRRCPRGGAALHPVRVHGVRQGLRVPGALQALPAQGRARDLQQPVDRQGQRAMPTR